MAIRELFDSVHNPVPSGPMIDIVPGEGPGLRFALWGATRQPVQGTVCIFQGRTEFIEKYFETISDLRRRGFAVVAVDWRGQGGSDRLLSNPHKGHVGSFADFEKDIDRLLEHVVVPRCPRPFVALGHSMGGNVLLRLAQRPVQQFDRYVLTAPMIQLAGSRVGYPMKLAHAYVAAGRMIGQGWTYVPGGRDTSASPPSFEANLLTTDAERYARNARVAQQAPQLTIGDPTVGWLAAAFKSMSELAKPGHARRAEAPILCFSAGRDGIVSSPAIEAYCDQLKIGRLVFLPNAKHEILQETNAIRDQVLAAFDAFMSDNALAA
ncbi:MAG: alpha/beta hydrolase [Pseudomonadota bacterium]